MGRSGTSNGKRQLEQPLVTPGVALVLKSQDGDVLRYRFPRDKRMQFLFSTYCQDKNLDYKVVVFLYDGRRVKSTKTPSELGIEDGDEIDCMVHHDGGGYTIATISTF
ncbi:hypothetical protein DH2020_027690 [Rehmannia glutinosa]|uniref:Ubiquitin-like domain-containing protein n=1 Tax=Rehmannia glutinosa TaxID=99300 RepID=A0ABR0VXK5_REHGL